MDNIALGLSPFNPDGVAMSAGRVMLGRMHELARAGRSFAMETTRAARGHVRFLRQSQNEGWRVTLVFLWLNDPDLAIRRVAQRMTEGGHNIPRDVILRRYWAGLRNLTALYLPLADTALIYDNSHEAARLIANKTREAGLTVRDKLLWTRMKEAADEGHDGP